MEIAASTLIIGSGLAHAVVNAVLKAGRDKMSGRALIDGCSALLIAPAAFYVPLPVNAWGWLMTSWAVHAFYLYTLIKSFEQSNMTVAYPIARGIAPVLAAAAAVSLFHEPITATAALGVGLIAGGVILIGFSHTVNRRSLVWALLTGSCIAAYTVIDAQGVRAAPSAASYIVWIFLMLGGGIGLVFAGWRGRAFLSVAAQQWRAGLIAGLLSIVSYGLALCAFRLGATPRLAALRETSILFGTAIAVIFLHERLSRVRAIGIGAVAIGAIALVSGG